MLNYLLNLTFDGQYFCGTQYQKDQLTLVGILKNKLDQIYKKDVKVICCSRLDSKVSAKSYYINFIEEEIFTAAYLTYLLNRYFPSYIHLNFIKIVPLDFNSRKLAKYKTYLYNINIGEANPLKDRFAFKPIFNIDCALFIKTIKAFEGKHDFSSFYSIDDKTLPLKEVKKVTVIKKGNYLQVKIKGHAFGRYQIRYMIGAAIQVSLNKMNYNDIIDRLNGNKMEYKNYKAPAEGLILYKVEY